MVEMSLGDKTGFNLLLFHYNKYNMCVFSDCEESFRRNGVAGLEHIYVDIKPYTSPEEFKVRCEIERDEGGFLSLNVLL